MKNTLVFKFMLIATCLPAASHASETTTYVYDTKGKLVSVVKSGGPNGGTTTTYNHDKADNRKKVNTTGAPC